MRPLKKFMVLTGSILLLLLPKKIVTACGFYVAPGEYRFWLLQPDLANAPDLTPFFFASTYLYKGNQYAVEEPYIKQNLEEWFRQVNGLASKTDIDTILNHTDPQTFFEEFTALAKNNSFLRYLLLPKNRELYEYLRLSKKVEQVAANPDPWEEKRFPDNSVTKIIDEAKALHRKARLPFIQLRTAFQLVRLYGINGQKEDLDNTYDSLIAQVPAKSWIKSAALYQKAINKSGPMYNYLLSKVFDRGDYNRTACLVRFQSSLFDSILPLAKNSHERSVLYAMKVCNYPGRSLPFIKTIYAMEPAYKEIAFLLLREINKVEDWLVTPKATEFPPAVYNGEYLWLNYDYYDNATVNYRNDAAYAKELYRFLLQIIKEKKNKDLPLFQLYAAHLALLTGNYDACRLHLSEAKRTKHLPANVRTQIKINELLLALQTEKGFRTPTENKLLSILQTPATQLGIYDPDIMKDQLILYTARKLINKGEKAKGLMLLSKTRRALGELPIETYKTVYQEMEEIATPADYDEILQILDKKNKTTFEKFISEGIFGSSVQYYDYYKEDYYEAWPFRYWDRNKILDGKATWYLQNNNLEAALQTIRQIPDSFWKKEPYATYIRGNPFYLNVYNAHRVTEKDRMDCNKKEVVEEMLRLQQIAKEDKRKAAECYYRLANAWYNMTWYGKNWLMLKQWWSVNETGYYRNDMQRTLFNDQYYGCSRARDLYLKAMNETSDRKLAALCCFMAGVCNSNFQEYLWNTKIKVRDGENFKEPSNPYRKNLKQKSIDNNYYEEIVKECAVYNSYIMQYNRP